MAKRSGNRVLITMGCTQCRDRNYLSSKSRINDTQRLELQKFCSKCGSHTLHREVR